MVNSSSASWYKFAPSAYSGRPEDGRLYSDLCIGNGPRPNVIIGRCQIDYWGTSSEGLQYFNCWRWQYAVSVTVIFRRQDYLLGWTFSRQRCIIGPRLSLGKKGTLLYENKCDSEYPWSLSSEPVNHYRRICTLILTFNFDSLWHITNACDAWRGSSSVASMTCVSQNDQDDMSPSSTPSKAI